MPFHTLVMSWYISRLEQNHFTSAQYAKWQMTCIVKHSYGTQLTALLDKFFHRLSVQRHFRNGYGRTFQNDQVFQIHAGRRKGLDQFDPPGRRFVEREQRSTLQEHEIREMFEISCDFIEGYVMTRAQGDSFQLVTTFQRGEQIAVKTVTEVETNAVKFLPSSMRRRLLEDICRHCFSTTCVVQY